MAEAETPEVVDRAAILVANKADLPARWSDPDAVLVSTVSGEGLPELRRRMTSQLGASASPADRPAITGALAPL